MSLELRVTSKGVGILTLVGTKAINWVRGKIILSSLLCTLLI